MAGFRRTTLKEKGLTDEQIDYVMGEANRFLAADYTCAIETLPLNYKGWHVGAKGNGRTVGFEIVEPKTISYKSGSTIDTSKYNPADAAVCADFDARWENAVALTVSWCNELNIDVEHVVSHAEAHRLGLATNHADTGHWFSLFGKTMDDFRNDVQAALGTPAETKNTQLDVDGKLGMPDVRAMQHWLGTTEDGVISGQSSVYKKYWSTVTESACKWSGGKSTVVAALQKEIGVTSDGLLGRNTARALQSYLIQHGFSCGSSGADGYFGTESTKALQRRLNSL